MADIILTKTPIDQLYVITPTSFEDNRGSFIEAYNKSALEKYGITDHFVQDNEVISLAGVLRGMHVNVVHPQAKLIRVIQGEIFDVVIDLRKNSETYMSCYSIRLSGDNKKQLYIPAGMGHGYLALEKSYVQFKVTNHFVPGDEIAFAWNSDSIKVDWPIKNPILNERDTSSKDLSEVWQ